MIVKNNKQQQKNKIIQVTVNLNEKDSQIYSEYFEDDENKADRYTDTYRENFTD